MRIKKFVAANMTEALEQVKKELGPTAIILNTRTNRKGGMFDFLGKTTVEVTAAVDEKPLQSSKPAAGVETPTPLDRLRDTPAFGSPSRPLSKKTDISPNEEALLRSSINREKFEEITGEIKSLRSSIEHLAQWSLEGDMAGLPAELSIILKTMISRGMEPTLAKKLIWQVKSELPLVRLADRSSVVERLEEILKERLATPRPIIMGKKKPWIVALVGSTGTGKTTTIAKLASEFAVDRKKEVAVLTTDTRRVDAVGQLKSYCRIIDLPLEVAYTTDDIPGHLRNQMKADLILVDTIGTSPNNTEAIEETRLFLEKISPDETHLVVSAPTSQESLAHMAERFDILGSNRLIVTKLDEVAGWGIVISAIVSLKKTLSYVTLGQNVPGDIRQVELGEVIGEILKND